MIPQTAAEIAARWDADAILRRRRIIARFRRLRARRLLLARRWW